MSSRRTTDRALGAAIIVLTMVAPLPFGSNHPVLWLLGTLLIGMVLALYSGLLIKNGRIWPGTMTGATGAMSAAGVYLAWVSLQGLPLSWLGLDPFQTMLPSDETVLVHDTISLTPGSSRIAAIRIAGYGALFFLAIQMAADRGYARRLARALTVCLTAWAIYGALAVTTFDDTILIFEKWAYEGVATGPFVNRNSFATFLAFGFCMAGGLAAGRLMSRRAGPGRTRRTRSLARMLERRRMEGLMMALAALILFAVLLRTGSRMGVLSGLAGGSLTLGLVIGNRSKLRPSQMARFAIAGTLLATLALILFGNILFDRLGSLERDADIRIALYKQIGQMIALKPWTGWGLDGFETSFRAIRTLPVSTDLSWDRAHSTYLALWAEAGLLAGSIPPLLMLAAFVACLRAALTRHSDVVLPAIGAGALLVGGIHSTVDFGLEMLANVWLLLVIVALALSRPARSEIPK